MTEDEKSRPGGGGFRNTLTPDSTAPIDFLNWLYGTNRDDRISICSFKPFKSNAAFTSNADAVAYAQNLDSQGAEGTYFRLTTLPAHWEPRKPGARGDAEESAYAYALAADLDLNGPGHVAKKLPYPDTHEDLIHLLEKAGLPEPSAWLHSGGGEYPIWKFAERVPAADAAELSGALHRHLIGWSNFLGWTMDNTNDMARVYRLPGTHNRKPDRTDQPVAIVVSMDGPVYEVAALSAILTDAPTAPGVVTTPTIPRPVSAPPAALPFVQPSNLFPEVTGRKNVDYTDESALTWLGEQISTLKTKFGTGGVYVAMSGFVLSCLHFETGFPHFMSRALIIEEIAKAAKEVHGWEELDSEDMDKIQRTFQKWDSGRVDDMWNAVRVETTAQAEPERSSWRRIDISHVLNGERTRVVPTLGRRQDGQRVLYAGKEHSVSSEPECGKTWWVLLQVMDILNEGGRVVYLDFEDDENTIVGRLLDMGCPASVLGEDTFRYARPEGPPPNGVITDECTFGDAHADLLVLDGVTEGMGAMGLDPLSQKDIVAWRAVAKEAMRLGTAVLSTDHETKNKETRGRYAIGGQHKLAGLNGVMFKMESVTSFTESNGGRSKILISKDRNGSLRNVAVPEAEGMAHLGDLVCKDGKWTFFEPKEEKVTPDASGVPKEHAEAVKVITAYLLKNPGQSQNLIQAKVGGRPTKATRALNWMIAEERVRVENGPNRSKLHHLTNVYAALADLAKDGQGLGESSGSQWFPVVPGTT